MAITVKDVEEIKVLQALRTKSLKTYELVAIVGTGTDRWAQGKNRNLDNTLRRLKAKGYIQFNRQTWVWKIVPGQGIGLAAAPGQGEGQGQGQGEGR